MAASIFAADIYEDGTPVLMARIYGTNASPISQITCSSIAYTITDTSTATVVASGTLSASSVIYDTLQTDAVWTKDATGYNFRWTPAASSFASPGITYAAEVAITTSGGDKIQVPFALTTVPIVRS